MAREDGFDFENNMFVRLLARLGDAMLLGMCFILFSIPIITIGASLTALYYTAIKGITLDGGYVWKYFTSSFKRNFKQATAIWLIFAVVLFVLGVDCWFWLTQWTQNHIGYAKIFLLISVIMFSVAFIMFMYVFGLVAKFENTVKGHIKNAALMAVKNFPFTMLLLLVHVFVIWAFYYTPVLAVIVYVIVGAGLLGYLNGYLLYRTFQPYLPDDTVRDDPYHVPDAEEDSEESES